MRTDWERDYEEYTRARLPGLRRTAYLLSGDTHRADDIVQQTLINLYVHWRRAARADRLDAYVHRMLVNVFLGERRLGWARVRLVAAVPDLPAAQAGSPDDREMLRVALLRVPPRQRTVLVLRFVHDLSITEVAALLECAEGTVKSQTARGLVTLRRALGIDAPAGTGRNA